MSKTERAVVKLIGCTEWADDYQCPACREMFTVAADSDRQFQPNKGHVCARLERKRHE